MLFFREFFTRKHIPRFFSFLHSDKICNQCSYCLLFLCLFLLQKSLIYLYLYFLSASSSSVSFSSDLRDLTFRVAIFKLIFFSVFLCFQLLVRHLKGIGLIHPGALLGEQSLINRPKYFSVILSNFC